MVVATNQHSPQLAKSILSDALVEAISAAGSQDGLACILQVSSGLITQWAAGDVEVPTICAERIEDLFQISKTRFRPDWKEVWPELAESPSANFSTAPREGHMHHPMKKLFISIRKGGVGKSTITCQLATYAHSLGLRVLVLDLDDQGNTTNFLLRGKVATQLDFSISEVLFNKAFPSTTPEFAFVPADTQLTQELVEKARTTSEHDGQRIELATLSHQSLERFFKAVEKSYDLCIIDGPPAQDIRVTMALALCDYVLSPIQLAQESVEGMRDTLSSPRGVLRIKGSVNPSLDFLGFLPNQAKSSPKQKEALQQLGKSHGQYFLRDQDDRLMLIPERESIRQAQGAGVSLQALATSNSGARETWPRLKNVLDRLLSLMQLEGQIDYISTIRAQQNLITKKTLKIANLYSPETDAADDSAFVAQLDSVDGGAHE